MRVDGFYVRVRGSGPAAAFLPAAGLFPLTIAVQVQTVTGFVSNTAQRKESHHSFGDGHAQAFTTVSYAPSCRLKPLRWSSTLLGG